MKTEITRLLQDHAAGETQAFGRLVDRVYEDLRSLAHYQLAKGQPGSLDTTGLVNEAYLKLAGHKQAEWQDRSHFFAVASLAMRSIVVDYARRLKSQKRGGDVVHVELEEDQLPELEHQVDEVLAVDAALDRLEKIEPRWVRIVEHRYFAGLTEKEAAEALAISHRSAQRLWSQARDWLRTELSR